MTVVADVRVLSLCGIVRGPSAATRNGRLECVLYEVVVAVGRRCGAVDVEMCDGGHSLSANSALLNERSRTEAVVQSPVRRPTHSWLALALDVAVLFSTWLRPIIRRGRLNFTIDPRERRRVA
jgi:hypothetical protein